MRITISAAGDIECGGPDPRFTEPFIFNEVEPTVSSSSSGSSSSGLPDVEDFVFEGVEYQRHRENGEIMITDGFSILGTWNASTGEIDWAEASALAEHVRLRDALQAAEPEPPSGLVLVGSDGYDNDGNEYIDIDCHLQQVWELHPTIDQDAYANTLNASGRGQDGLLYMLHSEHMRLYRLAERQNPMEPPAEAEPEPPAEAEPEPPAAEVTSTGTPVDSDEEPNECDNCGWTSYSYSTELCEAIGEGYYCAECVAAAQAAEDD